MSNEYAIAVTGGWRDFRGGRIIPVDEVGPGNPGEPGETLLGWQLTTTNTGLAKHGINGASLPLYTGSAAPAAGTVITERRITSSLDLSAGDITIERCLIEPTSVGQGLPVITTVGWEQDKTPAIIPNIIDCTIRGTALPNGQGKGFTLAIYGLANVRGCLVYDFGSGIATIGGNTTTSAVIEGNYVHSLFPYGNPATTGNHCDGYTVRGFSASSTPTRTLRVSNNRFECENANASGALFIQAIASRIDNLQVDNNYLEGNGYNLVLEAHSNAYNQVSAHNNRFRPTGYGPGYVSGGPGWQLFTENFRYHATNPDNKGVAVAL